MAKTRVRVNDEEQQLVERARELSKLQAKRRQKAIALAELDDELALAKEVLGDLVAGKAQG